MHEQQPNPRIAANRAFMESLDQLQTILAQERQTAESSSFVSGNGIDEPISMDSAKRRMEGCANGVSVSNVLEEAAADLDEFFGDAQLSEAGESSSDQ